MAYLVGFFNQYPVLLNMVFALIGSGVGATLVDDVKVIADKTRSGGRKLLFVLIYTGFMAFLALGLTEAINDAQEQFNCDEYVAKCGAVYVEHQVVYSFDLRNPSTDRVGTILNWFMFFLPIVIGLILAARIVFVSLIERRCSYVGEHRGNLNASDDEGEGEKWGRVCDWAIIATVAVAAFCLFCSQELQWIFHADPSSVRLVFHPRNR